MSSKDIPRYRIQAVARRTGIPAATLRAWERRYGIPRPVRTDSAYRTYSERDVELVEQLRRLCDSGLSPSDAASLMRDDPPHSSREPETPMLGQEYQVPGTAVDVAWPAVDADVYQATVARLVSAVRAMNIDDMEAELVNARSLGSSQQIFDKVLRPAMEAVGQLWHQGAISIGHEHLATELINATARDLLRLSQPSQGHRLALLACFADELHAGSLYGIAFRLINWGCRVAILGALTPPAALGPAVRKLRPAVVGLSVTIAPAGARARELVEGYAIACGDVPWVVGGQGAPGLASLITEFGGRVAPSDEGEIQRVFSHIFTPSS